MPQTVEAIDHAKAAEVPIVVALNKVDLPNANVQRALGQLAENGLKPAMAVEYALAGPHPGARRLIEGHVAPP